MDFKEWYALKIEVKFWKTHGCNKYENQATKSKLIVFKKWKIISHGIGFVIF